MNVLHLSILCFALLSCLAEVNLTEYAEADNEHTTWPADIPLDVTSIDLSLNSIADVPTDAFLSLTSLADLNLVENSLTIFPNIQPIAASIDSNSDIDRQ